MTSFLPLITLVVGIFLGAGLTWYGLRLGMRISFRTLDNETVFDGIFSKPDQTDQDYTE